MHDWHIFLAAVTGTFAKAKKLVLLNKNIYVVISNVLSYAKTKQQK